MIAVCFKLIAYFKNYTKKSLSALIIKSINKEFNTEIEKNNEHDTLQPLPTTTHGMYPSKNDTVCRQSRWKHLLMGSTNIF